jgi:four helix bundle protein
MSRRSRISTSSSAHTVLRWICIVRHCSFLKSNNMRWRIKSAAQAKSIGGNLAEGFGKQRQSSAEFKRYLSMAIGSADEMQVWLKYCTDLEYIDRRQCEVWRDEYRQIARMLQGLYSKWSSAPSDH